MFRASNTSGLARDSRRKKIQKTLAGRFLLLLLPALALLFVSENSGFAGDATITVRVRPLHDRFIDPQTFSGIHTANKYRLEAEPELQKGFHTKVERYGVNEEGSKALDLFQEISPLGFNIHRGMLVTFARQFRSSEEGKKAPAFTLASLPVSSALALRLQPGDFASYTAHMDFLLSADFSVPIFGFLGVGVGGHTAVSGDFLVQVFRLKDEQVRVRLLAIQGNEQGAEIGLRFGVPLVLLGVSTNLIDKISLAPLMLTGNRVRGVSAFLDLQYDLKDGASAAAFDRLLKGNVRFKNIAVRSPLRREKFEKLRFHDVTPTEALVRAGRVQQAVSFTGTHRAKSRGFRVNLGLLRISKGSTFSQNKVVATKSDGSTEHVVYETFAPGSLVKTIFNAHSDEKRYTLRMLMRSDAAFKPRSLLALSIVSERWVKNMRATHLERLRNEVRTALPSPLAAKAGLEQLDLARATDGYLRFEVALSEAGLAKLRRIEPRALASKLRTFLASQDLSELESEENERSRRWGRCSTIDCFDHELPEVAELLADALDTRQPWADRSEAFQGLMKKRLFQRFGAAIFVALLPPKERTELLSADVLVTARNGVRPLVFSHGGGDPLWNSLRLIHEAIFGRPFVNPLQ